MFILFLLITLVLFALLVLVAGAVVYQTPLSHFELHRRHEAGDTAASRTLERETLLADIVSIQRVIVALLLVVTVLMCVVTFGLLIGLTAALFVVLFYGAVAHMPGVQHRAQKLYEWYEEPLLHFADVHPKIVGTFRSATLVDTDKYHRIDSRDELRHLVERSEGVLSPREKKLIESALDFPAKLVRDVMTPKSVIDAVKSSELLGPLVLDELHQRGHSRLPVFRGDIDHVVGILHVRDLLTLHDKRSVTADKAMEAKVYYVREDQTLEKALAAFIKTRHHLFIVVNEYRETVGLLTLEDVIEALMGQKIVDEFDAHDDLRAVAEHNPRGNNTPSGHVDL